jgi:hypothetical protein
MSADGRAYVEKFSPYKGNALIIHMKMGDLANDTHDQRLFMGDAKMALLCRCSEKTLQRVRNRMMKEGYLRRVTPAQGRKGAEYQLLFPLAEIGGQNDHSTEIGGHFVPNRWTNGESTPTYRTEYNESENVDFRGHVRAIRKTLQAS